MICKILKHKTDFSDIFALTPSGMSYEVIGQHGQTSDQYLFECQRIVFSQKQLSKLSNDDLTHLKRLLRDLKSVGYKLTKYQESFLNGSLKVLSRDDLIWQGNYLEVEFPSIEHILNCSHQGACDDDIEACRADIKIHDHGDKENIKKELAEYTDWDLPDDTANLDRLIWIAAGGIQDSEGWLERIEALKNG